MFDLKNLKSQSQIITAILLILITISLVVIISGFAINLVNNKLSESRCVDFAGKLEITNNLQYTCYKETSKIMRVQVHVGDIEQEIQGFSISVNTKGSSESFEIIEGKDETNSIMMLGISDDYLHIPSKNSEKTYILVLTASTKPESLIIYPILKDGKSCDSSDVLQFVEDCKTIY